MDMMEWYFASDVDDLVVPKDQELFDSWSRWGITTSGSFGSPKKRFFSDTILSGEEFNFNGKGLQNGLLQQTAPPHELTDYQLNEQAWTDKMDDIFMSSLLEEDLTSTDDLQESFCFSPESLDHSEAHHIPSYTYDMGGPSMDWENEEAAPSCPPVKISMPSDSEQDSVNEHVDEEISLEETILHELERVTEQLTGKTRISFRDAFYRLAENSRQHKLQQTENGDLIQENQTSTMVHDETLSLGKTEAATESKTNMFDRGVANLLFNKIDVIADFPIAASLNFEQEATGSTGHRLIMVAGDAEVPCVGSG